MCFKRLSTFFLRKNDKITPYATNRLTIYFSALAEIHRNKTANVTTINSEVPKSFQRNALRLPSG
jgi:hypothetical protein